MRSIITDYNKCVACGSCITACQQAHGLPGTLRYRYIKAELDPHDSHQLFRFISCQHCHEPSCMTACSEDVYYISSEGVVLRREDNCKQCGQCLSACPHGAIQQDMASNRIGKCDLCADAAVPACCRACPQQAIRVSQCSD